MNKVAASYLCILGHVIVGIGILVLSEQVPLPSWLDTSVIVFLLFLAINLFYRRIFRLHDELQEFWGVRKLHYFLWGCIGGLAIASAPVIIGLSIGELHLLEFNVKWDISAAALGLTLIVVAWEELWFRGLILNYGNRHLSAINLSVTMGLLFSLVHMLNPSIDILQQGPALFFAGALLTILYFYYRTIWLPLGLHFGNNLFGTIIEVRNITHPLFGEDGYAGAIILAGLFIVFAFKTRKKKASDLLLPGTEISS